ncbi:MAG TPA: tyrosine-type recombinase/integrase [Geminicoccaceae bacterium]|nr:tyrosine-type recombinase/integrase [Geminicoccaceae bacterium]
MAAKLLTAAAVARVRPDPTRRLELPDRQQPGLYLVVQPSGRRSFAVRTRVGGKPVKITLGEADALDLPQARQGAAAAIAAARRGEDPRVQKSEQPAATVAAAVDEFIARYAKPRLKRWREVEARLKHDLVRAYGERPVAGLGRADLVRLLDEMGDRGVKQGANRLLAHTRRLLGWAAERGIVDTNVAASIKAPAKEVARDRVLDDEELASVWRACGGMGFPFGPLVRLMIVSAQREGEVAGLRWPDVDLDRAVWTLPREQTKADRAHVVPLSDLALEVLTPLPRLHDGELAFSTNGITPPSGWSRAKARLDRLSGVSGWRLHDLRRTAASTMARLGHPPQVVAAVLNHAPGATQGITAIYNRHRYDGEKRAALDAWARHVQQVTERSMPAPTGPGSRH